MNKADPFGDMETASDLTTDGEVTTDQPSSAPEEPIQADNVGALLCATRMRMSGDLQAIAKILRIRYGYLVAIEDGRYEDLPGSAYSVGFVRAYADYLGLDGNEVVRRLREETNGTVTKARFEFPAPSGESGLPNGGLLAIAIGMGVIVYGSWYAITNTDRDAVDLIQEMPSRIAVLIDEEPATIELADEPSEAEEATELMLSEVALDVQSQPQSIAEQSDSVESTQVPDTTLVDESDEALTSAVVGAVAQAEAVTELEEDPLELADASSVTDQLPLEPVVDEPVTETIASSLVGDGDQGESEPIAPDVSVDELAAAPISASESVSDELISEEAIDLTADAVTTADGLSPVDENADASSETATEVANTEDMNSEDAVVASQAEVLVQPDTSTQNAVSESADDGSSATITDNAETVPAEPTVIDQGTPDVLEAANQVIELRAKSDSWIQVRDGNELLLTRLLREGEVYQVPERSGLTLMTGNAGGLEVFVGGERMPPLGNEGVVRRGVPLSPERLRSGTAPG